MVRSLRMAERRQRNDTATKRMVYDLQLRTCNHSRYLQGVVGRPHRDCRNFHTLLADRILSHLQTSRRGHDRMGMAKTTTARVGCVGCGMVAVLIRGRKNLHG